MLLASMYDAGRVGWTCRASPWRVRGQVWDRRAARHGLDAGTYPTPLRRSYIDAHTVLPYLSVQCPNSR